jgi:hypothetical protein
VWTGRFLALFSLDTGGTAMEDGVMVFDRWDTNDKLVGITLDDPTVCARASVQ